ncbi:MAG: acyl--CoA ligase [Candidatus Nanopelagicales bacterium]|nr:acyl--CoA ligase [Candidatus Nanopelagicales bacterium]
MATVPVLDAAGTELLTPEAAEELGARFVGLLRGLGVEPGARVVFQAPNSARLLAGVAGSLRGGYAAVVISAALTPRERDELVADVDPALVVDDARLRAAHAAAPVPLDPWFRARPMHFTSGTSGRPKAVWSGWQPATRSEAWVAEEVHAWGFGPGDRHLVCGPMSHSAPLRFPMLTLAAGGSVLVPPRFDPAVAGRLIEDGTATTSFMAPAHLQRILGAARPPARAAMRLLAHAGSACPSHVRQRARALVGDDALREFYGSTEGQFTTCTPTEFDARPGTVGRARPGRELRVDDEGHIWCRVPEHARFTYWGDPEKTAAAWDGDAFTVGDLGRLDEAGYLYLDGRRSDLIITGGVNVYPAELERVVLELPGVEQAVAFGVDDERWGQRVCLAVVGAVPEARIHAHCAEELAPYKRPKSIHVLDAFPLTHNGKVDRVRVPQVLGLV